MPRPTDSTSIQPLSSDVLEKGDAADTGWAPTPPSLFRETPETTAARAILRPGCTLGNTRCSRVPGIPETRVLSPAPLGRLANSRSNAEQGFPRPSGYPNLDQYLDGESGATEGTWRPIEQIDSEMRPPTFRLWTSVFGLGYGSSRILI